MSYLNIQWKRSKPIGILAILAGFATLSQIPIIYHAREILEVVKSKDLPAYIAVTIAALIVVATAETLLYEGLLIRVKSFDINDYRIPFLSAAIVNLGYFIFYFVGYNILNGIELFQYQPPVVQYAFCQMVALLIVMGLTIWYNNRQNNLLAKYQGKK
ncbi:MAG: hypothetical protein GF308_21095 [Candidatus Heimdallarchaeota archaeon]|nr:hypothetical protein [Candidatus Heimdallarchaeota archaeon]